MQEIVEDAGHIFIFYLKVHCELNWIEYYWGRCKYFARKHCNYTLPGQSTNQIANIRWQVCEKFKKLWKPLKDI